MKELKDIEDLPVYDDDDNPECETLSKSGSTFP